nr:MAG TPA: hypothetical protein [Bacteriophage sp.]
MFVLLARCLCFAFVLSFGFLFDGSNYIVHKAVCAVIHILHTFTIKQQVNSYAPTMKNVICY